MISPTNHLHLEILLSVTTYKNSKARLNSVWIGKPLYLVRNLYQNTLTALTPLQRYSEKAYMFWTKLHLISSVPCVQLWMLLFYYCRSVQLLLKQRFDKYQISCMQIIIGYFTILNKVSPANEIKEPEKSKQFCILASGTPFTLYSVDQSISENLH